jgi:iron complex transport system ATP-binding protein
VLTLVRRLARQKDLAVVITLHDLNQAAFCAHRLALLSQGSLVALGTPEEVLTPDCLTPVYGIPIVVTQHPVYGTPMVAPLFAETAQESPDA